MSDDTRADTRAEIETPHELVLVDEFAASPAEVWAAWTEPERFAQWWVAPDWTTSDLTLDARPRGRFRATQSADDGSVTMPFAGFYLEAEPERRLVFTLSDDDDPDVPSRTVLTVHLTATDSGTRQEFRQTGVVTDEHFEQLEAGTRMFFDQLAAHLEGR